MDGNKRELSLSFFSVLSNLRESVPCTYEGGRGEERLDELAS